MRRVPLVACVERLHAEGYVVLGPENAEEAAQLLGWLAFPEKLAAFDELDLPGRAADVLAAFPESFLLAASPGDQG